MSSSETVPLSITLEKDVSGKENTSGNLSENSTSLDFSKQVKDLQLLALHYINLSKIDQIGMVILPALHGYGMSPGTFELITLTCMVLGGILCSASVFSINQVLELPYDAQMDRTKNRPLIRGHLTTLHASIFAFCFTSIGLTTIYLGTNTLTTALAVVAMIIYISIYTPLKRYSITNTWVGAAVDGLVPIIGWSACSGSLNAGAVLLGVMIYSWQFPRFNAYSFKLRKEYSTAGYLMASVVDPALSRRVALRHSVGLLALCSCAPLLDLTTWTFALQSFPLNCYLIYNAWNFHRNGDDGSANKLFRACYFYLPVLMLLMLSGKKYSSM